MTSANYSLGDPYSPSALDPDDPRMGSLSSLLKGFLGGSLTTYAATFSAVAVSAAQDLFEIAAPSTHRVCVRKCFISQYSDFGDAQAELLSVTVLRGYTTTGSGGSAVTPVNFKPWGPAANSTVAKNNTTVASNGSPVTLIADAFNVAAGWWLPQPIWLDVSTRLVIRISAPADSLTMNGTLVFDEVKR